VVPKGNAELVMDRVASTDKELVLLNDSYHVATLDHDAEQIFERTHEFAEAKAPAAHRADDLEADEDAEASSQDR
jgi:carboxylesterase